MRTTKSYLKLLLSFPFLIIKNNIGKSILIVISIIGFHFAGTFEDVKYEKDIISTVKTGNTELYIYKYKGNSDTDEFKMVYGDDYKIENGKITWIEYSYVNIIMWCLFGMPLVVVVLMMFIGLDWELNDSWKEAITLTIYTVYEEDTYYYMSFGRLLGKRDHLIRRSNLLYELGISSLSDILYCPLFETKTERRENLLNRIGIR